MLQRDLKKVANESVFNPNKPETADRILFEIGDSKYWLTRASEHLAYAKNITPGSDGWHNELKQAIKLLILARAKKYGK